MGTQQWTGHLQTHSHPGAVGHACNPCTLGGWGSGSQGQEFKTSLANMVRPPSTKRIPKQLYCRWYFQLLGSLRQENCLNQGDGGCSEPRLHHCTPAWATERDPVSKIYIKHSCVRVPKFLLLKTLDIYNFNSIIYWYKQLVPILSVMLS